MYNPLSDVIFVMVVSIALSVVLLTVMHLVTTLVRFIVGVVNDSRKARNSK